jgi:hypothetical protein
MDCLRFASIVSTEVCQRGRCEQAPVQPHIMLKSTHHPAASGGVSGSPKTLSNCDPGVCRNNVTDAIRKRGATRNIGDKKRVRQEGCKFKLPLW